MGRQPCCDKVGLKKGPWIAEEDKKLINFILSNGQCCWRSVPKLAGLLRCGKSCRLRWTNYLRPDLKRGLLSESEEKIIIDLHSQLGNRWSKIAAHLPGRTDNDIKNHWNTHIKKKLRKMGLDPLTHKPVPPTSSSTEEESPTPCLLSEAADANKENKTSLQSSITDQKEEENNSSSRSLFNYIESISIDGFCPDEVVVPLIGPQYDIPVPPIALPSSSAASSSSSHSSGMLQDFKFSSFDLQEYYDMCFLDDLNGWDLIPDGADRNLAVDPPPSHYPRMVLDHEA